MDIGDPCALEVRRQHVEVELRMGPRPRDTSDIDETGHLERPKNVNGLVGRTRRMSNRKKRTRAPPRPREPGGETAPWPATPPVAAGVAVLSWSSRAES